MSVFGQVLKYLSEWVKSFLRQGKPTFYVIHVENMDHHKLT